MPVRNASLYIEECIDSIINQDFEDWELIAINDHSDDETGELLNTYSHLDSRITTTNNIGKGIIPALQLAYQLSSGKYITRMDADDIMTGTKLSSLYNILISHGQGILATGGVRYFSADGIGDGYRRYEEWLNGLCIDNTHFSEIYKECVIPSPCWMISRYDFELCGGFMNDCYPEDYDLCFRFYKSGLKVKATTEILHHWRDYEIRSSRTDDNYKDNRFLDLKISYFLSLDYKLEDPLFLWGAGKKAKKIAQLLIGNHVKFHWISNNPKKIGRDIYGVIIENQEELMDNSQVIIAVGNEQEKLLINSKIKKIKNISDYYFS